MRAFARLWRRMRRRPNAEADDCFPLLPLVQASPPARTSSTKRLRFGRREEGSYGRVARRRACVQATERPAHTEDGCVARVRA